MRNVVLKPHVGYCVAGPHLIFLDAERDRYCMLAGRLEAHVRDWATGDIPEPAVIAELVATGLFERAPNSRTASELSSVPRCTRALCGSHSTTDRSPGYWLRFLWACSCLVFFNALRDRLSLRILLTLSGAPRKQNRKPPDPEALISFLDSFSDAALLFPRKDRCLPDALALRAFLAWQAYPSRIVFGVQSEPFQAHCWVQSDNTVLVQDLETVMGFSPILALP
ncbi:lasso peptide biosynthesis B2 protein [Sphingobium sp. TCM1]|uniref:lasso peptide biosynthesis B2 protein n=1 Tax=Sphingobium sp. TCM1 TaxID=453246 RepID=UPI0007F49A04|nr:lasso peptide biosynthesis B2 protein [Sphingobium sp. TCM1]OAN58640.1 hypothetical protein A7Q26_13415 [Sphingobium sp. TCM1]